MGACCGGPELLSEGEQYIDKALYNQYFYLKDINYEGFNSKIDECIKPNNYKEEVVLRKKIYPIIFEDSDKNKFLSAHKGVVSELISHIENRPPTKIDLIFTFFPFLFHDQNEKTNEILFQIFEKTNKGKMNLNQLKEMLNLYIENTTTTLTFAMWNSISDNNFLRKAFDDMEANIYTNLNREQIIEQMTEKLEKENSNSSKISQENFVECVKDYELGNYRIIRNIFTQQFQEK